MVVNNLAYQIIGQLYIFEITFIGEVDVDDEEQPGILTTLGCQLYMFDITFAIV